MEDYRGTFEMELKWLSQTASSVMAAVNLSQGKALRRYQKDDSFHLGKSGFGLEINLSCQYRNHCEFLFGAVI